MSPPGCRTFLVTMFALGAVAARADGFIGGLHAQVMRAPEEMRLGASIQAGWTMHAFSAALDLGYGAWPIHEGDSEHYWHAGLVAGGHFCHGIACAGGELGLKRVAHSYDDTPSGGIGDVHAINVELAPAVSGQLWLRPDLAIVLAIGARVILSDDHDNEIGSTYVNTGIETSLGVAWRP